MTYFEEDFIYNTKPKESPKDCEVFLQEKYASRKAKDPSIDIPKRIQLHETKLPSHCRTSIANITWGKPKSTILGATFRQR